MDLLSFFEQFEFIDESIQVFLDHPYIFLFVGLLIGGESLLLPVIYLSLIGIFNLWYVASVTILATVISDSFWYFAGRGLSSGISRISISPRVKKTAERFSIIFKGQSLPIIFLSKFVYGTRTAIQVLAGVHKIPFLQYFFVNIGGVMSLFLFYVAGMFVFSGATEMFLDYFHRGVLLLISVIGVIAVSFFVSNFLKKRWFQ